MADPNELIEVKAADYAANLNARKILESLWGNRETATAFKRMVKKVNPEMKIPDLELAEEFAEPLKKELDGTREQLSALRKEVEDDRKKRLEDGELSDIHAKIDAVARKRGLTEEGKAGLIDTMNKRQIADPDAAALVYLETLPKPKVQKGQAVLPQRMNLFGVNTAENQDEKLDRLFKDPMGFMDDEIAEILNEEAA